MLAKPLGLTALIAVLILAPAGPAQAGHWPHERDGVVLGFNLGAGTAGINFTGVDSDREGGLAGGLRVGYVFTPELAVGLDGTFWTKEVNDETWTFNVGTAALTYYPGAKGFFVRGGIGVGSMEFSTEESGVTFSASDDGFGFLLGTGYEWRLTRKFAMGPEVDYSYAKVSDDISLNYVNFTVGLNWYF
jgi:opacity protein-like surface antigen